MLRERDAGVAVGGHGRGGVVQLSAVRHHVVDHVHRAPHLREDAVAVGARRLTLRVPQVRLQRENQAF